MTSTTTTQDPQFGETETIKVAHLRVGDWVESFPSQRGIRGSKIGSGVKTIEPSFRWYTQSRPRGPRMPLEARKITFLMIHHASLDVPDGSDIIVRRRLA